MLYDDLNRSLDTVRCGKRLATNKGMESRSSLDDEQTAFCPLEDLDENLLASILKWLDAEEVGEGLVGWLTDLVTMAQAYIE